MVMRVAEGNMIVGADVNFGEGDDVGACDDDCVCVIVKVKITRDEVQLFKD
jgi:hypothetical protein